MTTGDNLAQGPGDQVPLAQERSTQTRLKQLAIVLVSAIILSASSCAGMMTTFFNHQILFLIAAAAFIVGLVAIPITMIWTAVILVRRNAKKRDMGTGSHVE